MVNEFLRESPFPLRRGRGRMLWAAAIVAALFGIAFVAYAASGWTSPVTLANPIPPSFYMASPVVAVNSLGAQAAAWVNESNYLLLQVAAQDSGGAWSAATTLTPASGVNAAEPGVAISPAGNAVAIWTVWQANSSQGLVIQASSRPAHGSWGAVKSLTSPATSSNLPKVGMDANGNAVAIWLQTTSTSTAIETASLPAAGSWTAPVTISTAGVTAANPTLAVNALGDAIAGWQTASGQILVAERRSGVWAAPVSIAPAAYRQGSPHVALNNRGDAAIAWTGRGTALVATRSAGGAWSAPLTISKQSSGASARIALDDSGNGVMIFQLVQYTGGGYVYPVEGVARPAGGSWGTAHLISAAGDYGATPNLVATPAGTFVAAWVDDNTRTVRAAIQPAGQTVFGAPAVIGSGSDALLAATSGHTAATWIGAGVQVSNAGTP